MRVHRKAQDAYLKPQLPFDDKRAGCNSKARPRELPPRLTTTNLLESKRLKVIEFARLGGRVGAITTGGCRTDSQA